MIIRMLVRRFIVTPLIILLCTSVFAQETQEIFDYLTEEEYVVGGVSVSGIRYLDINALIGISGLRVGQKIAIPGEIVSNAAKKLWQQGLFSDVRITINRIESDTAYFDIYLQERPRISSININGVRSTERQDILEKINLPIGSQLTSYIMSTTSTIIKDHFVEKGFLNTTVDFVQKDDPDQPNNVILNINIDKKERVKIEEFTFAGNESFDGKKLRRQMKGTKKKNLNFFKPSKFIDDKFEEDKESLVMFYNDNGFRDFTILEDSLYRISEDRVGVHITVDEGDQYFLRDVKWVGNSVYRTEDLDRVFNVDKGTVYNQSLIYDRLTGSGGAQDAVNNPVSYTHLTLPTN